MTILERLTALKDEKYAAFTAKLIPNVDPTLIIGVRSPQIALLAKEMRNTVEAQEFMASLPHTFLEENATHAALLNRINDFETAMKEVERFLPFIDNWATCDTLSPKCFSRHKDSLLPHVRRWVSGSHEYTVRFGIGMLMRHYLDDSFDEEYHQLVASIAREEYYIRMMQAWYFATALAKQWDATVPFMVPGKMTEWVRRKSIQKAIESYRVSSDHKQWLRGLR